MDSRTRITIDAVLCAESCWWPYHDQENWEATRTNVILQEKVISAYKGQPIRDEEKEEEAGNYFIDACRAYNELTKLIEKDLTSEQPLFEAKGNVRKHLKSFYEIVGEKDPNTVAEITANWWMRYARATKAKDEEEFLLHHKGMLEGLIEEHKVRFSMDAKTATEFANLLAGAVVAHHNPEHKDILKIYYKHLLSYLDKKSFK